jgi:Cu/Ag efflux pump CusA
VFGYRFARVAVAFPSQRLIFAVRSDGDRIAAAVQAGATRLRPVLLTAVTTILGLVPMATGKSFDIHTLEFSWRSESSQFWSSMAVAVIFGLAFATMLTLVVVPVLYVSLYRLASRFGMGGLDRPGAEAAEVAAGSQDH